MHVFIVFHVYFIFLTYTTNIHTTTCKNESGHTKKVSSITENRIYSLYSVFWRLSVHIYAHLKEKDHSIIENRVRCRLLFSPIMQCLSTILYSTPKYRGIGLYSVFKNWITGILLSSQGPNGPSPLGVYKCSLARN